MLNISLSCSFQQSKDEQMSIELPDIHFFHQLADKAESETMSRFRAPVDLHIQSKEKAGLRFDPVTDADREAERVMRALITEHYPDHQICGEEFGLTGQGPWQWVLDPVDGTRPFLCGLPVWGTLIGLYYNNRAQMGMMAQPVTAERFWADGKSAWYQGPAGKQQLRSKQQIKLSDAILHTTSPEPIARNPQIRFDLLNEQCLMTRYGGECYAMAMLAAGHIDICLEYSLQPYDIAAFIPIIEQAGGCVTLLDGSRAEAGGAVVASANPKLHEQVLSILNSRG